MPRARQSRPPPSESPARGGGVRVVALGCISSSVPPIGEPHSFSTDDLEKFRSAGLSAAAGEALAQLVGNLRAAPSRYTMRKVQSRRMALIEEVSRRAGELQRAICGLEPCDSISIANDPELGGPEFGQRLASLEAVVRRHAEWLESSGLLEVPEESAAQLKARVLKDVWLVCKSCGVELSTSQDSHFWNVCTVIFEALNLEGLYQAVVALSKQRGLSGTRKPKAKSHKPDAPSIARNSVFDTDPAKLR